MEICCQKNALRRNLALHTHLARSEGSLWNTATAPRHHQPDTAVEDYNLFGTDKALQEAVQLRAQAQAVLNCFRPAVLRHQRGA